MLDSPDSARRFTDNCGVNGVGDGRTGQKVSHTALLLVAAFGAFLAFLDSTVVNIAFPAIQRCFHHSDISSLSWILNGYNIAFAALLVASGGLADLFGRKRMFIYGVVSMALPGLECPASHAR